MASSSKVPRQRGFRWLGASSDSLSATPRGLGASGLPVLQIPEIPLKLVRKVEITANFHRCKKYFEELCRG
jgi:hypothetical protein